MTTKKRLYLLRHAKSSWDDPSIEDFKRPLNKRGQRDAPAMGRRFRERGYVPDRIVSSPAERAYDTARTVARELGYAVADIVTEDELYLAGSVTLLEYVHATPDALGSLMLVAHNPGMTDLANSLTDQRIDNLPTCGLYCADFSIQRWHELSPGSGTLVCFDYPKKSR